MNAHWARGRQSSAASAIDRGAATFSKRTLPAGTIQVILRLLVRELRRIGPTHEQHERVAVELHAANQTRLS
jgi:hypothetical protein